MSGQTIVAWRFFAELPQPDESMLPRHFYVRLSDRAAAARALGETYPRAILQSSQPLTAPQLTAELGNEKAFRRDDIVLCVAV